VGGEGKDTALSQVSLDTMTYHHGVEKYQVYSAKESDSDSKTTPQTVLLPD